MTDNEITREKTFSEELPYFKERIKEVFDNYDNPNGYEDPLYIAVLRDSNRIVRKAEEEINRQQVENKRLEKEVNLVSIQFQDLQERYEESQAEIERLEKTLNGQDQLINSLNKCYKQAKSETIKEFAEKLKENLDDCHIVSNGEYCGFDCGDIHECIDDILKEMVGAEE